MGQTTGVRSPAKAGTFLFPITTIPALGPIQQHIQWVDDEFVKSLTPTVSKPTAGRLALTTSYLPVGFSKA